MAMMMKPVLIRDFPECICTGRRCSCAHVEAGSELDYKQLSLLPRVLAVDPGTHTGWSVVWFDPDILFSGVKVSQAIIAWQAGMVIGPELGQVDALLARAAAVGGEGLALVCESFVVMEKRQEETFLSPVRVGRQFEYGAHRGQREQDREFRRRKVWWQTPGDAKKVITDARLRLWNMWLPGADHPRDATKHALLWIRRVKSEGESFYDSAHFVDQEEED